MQIAIALHRSRFPAILRGQPWGVASLLGICVAAIVVLLMTVYTTTDIAAVYLMRDPNAITGTPFYFGAVSTAAAVMWICGAVIGLFVSLRMWRYGRRDRVWCLALPGVLALALGLDDLFMIHDGLMREFGLSELYLFPIYAGLGALTAFALLRAGFFDDILLLLLGGGTFALSLVLDVLADEAQILTVNIEDTFKLAGIFFWTAYLVRRSWAADRC
jgi:hypothetical protein